MYKKSLFVRPKLLFNFNWCVIDYFMSYTLTKLCKQGFTIGMKTFKEVWIPPLPYTHVFDMIENNLTKIILGGEIKAVGT